MVRLGVVVTLATGTLAVISTPALAVRPDVSGPSSAVVKAGGDVTVTLTVEAAFSDATITINPQNLPSGVSCASGCGDRSVPETKRGQPNQYPVTLRAAGNAPAANQGITFVVTVVSDSRSGNASMALAVQAAAPQNPPPAAGVKEVSGTVTDQATGSPLGDAAVSLKDGAGKKFDTQADGQGRYKFTGTASKPISPGTLELTAEKDGFKTNQPILRQVGNGQSLTGLKIALLAANATATPTETATDTATAGPTDEQTTGEASNDQGQAGADNNQNSDDGTSPLSIVLIGMGALLVALGIGAIALLLWRRRNESDDDEEEDEEGEAPGPGTRSPAPRPATAAAYNGAADPTMVRGGVGDRTMITRPALADAPTAMHQPVMDDEFPDPYNPPQDPYGAPTTYSAEPMYGGGANGEYGGGGAYGSPATGRDPYGHEPEYGGPARPASGPGYGPTPGAGYAPTSSGGYGAPAGGGGYDQAGGGYGAPAGGGGYGQGGYDDGYQQGGGGYGQQGYAPDNGYGGGGYDQGGGGYGAPAGGGGYDDGGYGGQGAGYGDQGGYDEGYRQQQGGGGGGYGQQGYAPDNGYGGGGYDQGGGGYGDQRGGQEGYYDDEGARHGSQSGRGGQRRSLDWLDD